jgi:2'-5' RNA ligase
MSDVGSTPFSFFAATRRKIAITLWVLFPLPALSGSRRRAVLRYTFGMKKKRLFVAIPLSGGTVRSVKRIMAELAGKFERFTDTDFALPFDISQDPNIAPAVGKIRHGIRFAPQGNWHLTVTFLGDQDDIVLPAIADAVKIASWSFPPPEIVFEKISYGPPAFGAAARPPKFFGEKSGRARMIWLCADRASSERIAKIKDVLDATLASRGVPFQKEMKLFSGHITLARFTGEMELASLPQIERPLRFSFSAASLDLMESELKRSGAEYGLLQSFDFKE